MSLSSSPVRHFRCSHQSSLLSAILGELPHDTGTLKVRGRLNYASQQPWVFPGTIRSNIVFGRELDPQKYEKVLRACALKKVMCRYIPRTYTRRSRCQPPSSSIPGPGAAPGRRPDAHRGQGSQPERRTEGSGQPGEVRGATTVVHRARCSDGWMISSLHVLYFS